MRLKTIRDADVGGKKVLLRVDYNVPLSPGGEPSDTIRIEETLPTLQHLLEGGASLVLMSHLGRPGGRADPRFSLRPAAKALEYLTGRNVVFSPDTAGPAAARAAQILKPGEILMLENLRFRPEEESNGVEFARTLASFGDLFVNDAFGACHRAHASVVGIPKLRPAFAGFLVEKEVEMLSRLLENPPRPYFAVLGGAKLSGKLGAIRELLKRVDLLLVGGAVAFTFLKAQGYYVGKSPVEESFLGEAAEILKKNRGKILLPSDCAAAPSLDSLMPVRRISFSKERDEMQNLCGFDLGAASAAKFREVLAQKRPQSVFWNGPTGVFEIPRFSAGTRETAEALAERAEAGAFVVVGGGDSAAAVKLFGLSGRMIHISTGGGASLEFLEGKILPGLAPLEDAAFPSKA